MAAKKTERVQVVASVDKEESLTVPLKDIDVSFENTRTGDFTKGDSEPTEKGGQSFQELKDSIKLGGQRTAVVVRRKGKKLQLISGFRRYTAIKQLALENGDKEPTIKVVIKELDDLQAVIENVTENNRENLTGPDLAFGLWKILNLAESRGQKMSDRVLADLVGKNNTYVSQLLKIIRKAPKIAKMWHDAEHQLSVKDMTGLAKVEGAGDQLAAYNDLLKDKAPKDPNKGGSSKGPGGKPWIESAIDRVSKTAYIMGRLQQRGCVNLSKNMVWADELETLGVKVKADATKRDRNQIASKAAAAFKEGLNYKEPPPKADKDDSQEDESEEAA